MLGTLGWSEPVVDEVVQSNDRADERREVNNDHHVIRLHCERLGQVRGIRVGEQVEDVLHLVHDLREHIGHARRQQLQTGKSERARARALCVCVCVCV